MSALHTAHDRIHMASPSNAEMFQPPIHSISKRVAKVCAAQADVFDGRRWSLKHRKSLSLLHLLHKDRVWNRLPVWVREGGTFPPKEKCAVFRQAGG